MGLGFRVWGLEVEARAQKGEKGGALEDRETETGEGQRHRKTQGSTESK